jgi:hypothetical protein
VKTALVGRALPAALRHFLRLNGATNRPIGAEVILNPITR